MAIDGAMQLRRARRKRLVDSVDGVKKDFHGVYAGQPFVTISSCLCDRTGARGCNKAGVEKKAANQERDGPVPHATLRRREIVGKFPIVAFFQTTRSR